MKSPRKPTVKKKGEVKTGGIPDVEGMGGLYQQRMQFIRGTGFKCRKHNNHVGDAYWTVFWRYFVAGASVKGRRCCWYWISETQVNVDGEKQWDRETLDTGIIYHSWHEDVVLIDSKMSGWHPQYFILWVGIVWCSQRLEPHSNSELWNNQFQSIIH